MQIEKGRLVIMQEDFLDLLGVSQGSPVDPTYTTLAYDEFFNDGIVSFVTVPLSAFSELLRDWSD